MDVKIEFTDKEITPWGGISLLQNMLKRMSFEQMLSDLPLPTQGSNRGYSPQQLIQHFLIGVWCGASCFEHLEVTRHDRVIKDLFGWKTMAGSKAFHRYFNKFNQATNQQVFDNLYSWFFDKLQFDNYTLDFDSTVITRYGDQQGATKGYNPKKPGRNSHHPLLAFVSDCRMIANFWLRPGNTGSSNNFLSFLENTLHKMGDRKVGLIRADSGFYSDDIMSYLEKAENKHNYIIAAKFYKPLKCKMAKHRKWWPLDDGLEIAETTYQADGWEKARRMVMVRQYVPRRPKAIGKQLSFFEDDNRYKDYRYSCYFTNSDLPAKAIYDLYRGRADCENRIKEIKYDFGAGNFNMRDFWATEASLNFVMMAYNLMSLFRVAVLKSKKQNFLKTLRYKTFAIGGYLVKNGNSRILKLSLAMKRRQWFKGLWSSSSYLALPHKY